MGVNATFDPPFELDLVGGGGAPRDGIGVGLIVDGATEIHNYFPYEIDIRVQQINMKGSKEVWNIGIKCGNNVTRYGRVLATLA